MVSTSEVPILIDFGITLHFSSDGSRTGTSKNRSTGCSDGFAPLEQYSGVNYFNPQLDVYALGATLYYMLVGKDPAKSEPTKAFVQKIASSIPQNVSVQTRNAILHALKVQLDERTQTAEELLNELPLKGVLPPPPLVKPEKKPSKSYNLTIVSRGPGVVEVGGKKVYQSAHSFTFQKKQVDIIFRPDTDAFINRIEEDGVSLMGQELSNIQRDLRKNVTLEESMTIVVSFSMPEDVIIPKDELKTNLNPLYYILFAAIILVGIYMCNTLKGDNGADDVVEDTSIGTTWIYEDGKVVGRYDGYCDHIFLGDSIKLVPEGQGTITYRDVLRKTFEGTFVNGERLEGTLIYKNGDTYTGTFSDDKFDEGTYTEASGYYFKGVFKNNDPYNGSWYNKSGNVYSKVVNGVQK